MNRNQHFRKLWRIICAALLTGIFLSANGRAQMSAKPVRLRCEYQREPLGIDVKRPRFSWEIKDERRGAKQTAYRILVATSEDRLSRDDGDIWDSGVVDSEQSVLVEYAGPELKSTTRYFWKVRIWDQNGEPTAWSDAASWETALLNSGDWQAKWIAAGKEGEMKGEKQLGGKWIWHPRERGIGRTVYFRKTFEIPSSADLDTIFVSVTADNRYTLYLNGLEVGSGQDWRRVQNYDVHLFVHQGTNVIAIAAANTKGNICGLISNLHARKKDGSVIEVFTDESWRTTDKREEGWSRQDFDDSGWEKPLVIAEYGEAPWGRFGGVYTPPRSQMVRKEFRLTKGVRRARVYVTGLGSYRLFINGQRVGRDELTPGWTDYRDCIQYQTYDVTDLLRQGGNAVGAVLGNAWWCGELGWEMKPQYSRGPLRLLMQMHVLYEDGTEKIVATDGSWKCHESPILYNSLYNGETYDARLELPGWSSAGYDDSAWKNAQVLDAGCEKLVAQQAEPIRVTEELTPVRIHEPKPGVFVADMGQNFSGWVRLKVTGLAGTKVQLRFAEVLNPDGTIYTDNYRKARATDTYILKGDGVEVWEPTFTYRGYRYVEITGFPGRPDAQAVTGIVVHSAVPKIGEFSCSDELINQIHKNVLWGIRSNLHSVPTDCPQRDERLGWTGDAQIIAPTACYNFNMARLFSRWLRDLASSQDEQGAVRDVAPAVVVGENPAAPAWGDAIVLVPWVVHQMSGDRRVIEEIYPAAVRWFEYMEKNARDGLYDREGYGDWIAVVPSPKKPIAGAYFYYDAVLLSKMAAVLGRTEDSKTYAEKAGNIRRLFNKRYLDASANWYEGRTQTANVLPLAFGIVPEGNKEQVAKVLVEDVISRDYHLTTGFLGTAYLLPVLTRYGYEDVAFRLATQTTYPSWGYMVKKDATTIWELWDSDVKGPGMNSRNHYALGAVDRWFYEAIGGVRPDPNGAGFKRAIIWPQLTPFLEWARVKHVTEYGELACSWQKEDGRLIMEVGVPVNASAEVHVPVENVSTGVVSEGGDVLFRDGRAVANKPYVRFVKAEGQFVVFNVDGGRYSFAVQNQ